MSWLAYHHPFCSCRWGVRWALAWIIPAPVLFRLGWKVGSWYSSITGSDGDWSLSSYLPVINRRSDESWALLYIRVEEGKEFCVHSIINSLLLQRVGCVLQPLSLGSMVSAGSHLKAWKTVITVFMGKGITTFTVYKLKDMQLICKKWTGVMTSTWHLYIDRAAVDFVCFSAWIAFPAFDYFFDGKQHTLKFLHEQRIPKYCPWKRFSVHWVGPAACWASQVWECKYKCAMGFWEQICIRNHVETQLCGKDLGFESPGNSKLFYDRYCSSCVSGVCTRWAVSGQPREVYSA